MYVADDGYPVIARARSGTRTSPSRTTVDATTAATMRVAILNVRTVPLPLRCSVVDRVTRLLRPGSPPAPYTGRPYPSSSMTATALPKKSLLPKSRAAAQKV